MKKFKILYFSIIFGVSILFLIAHFGSKIYFKFVDYEAIGESFDSLDDTVVIELNDIPEKGKMYITPQYEARVAVKDILDEAPHKTMTVDEFFKKRNYNSRCIDNFNGIKEYLK